MGTRRFRDEYRQELREERRRLNRMDALLDYIDELEAEVEHWKSRYQILLEAKTEAENEEVVNGSSDLDK